MAAAERGSREERWSLAGATALVTGGSKGIGGAIVEELAGFGARVHTCSRNAAELECCLRWEEKGMRVTVSVCHVSVPADREKLMDTVRQTFDGKLSILVNNAGQHLVKPTVECTMEEYKNVMATNLESSFHLCQLAHPLLARAVGGNIINISSIASSIGFAGSTIYTITKGALNQLTWSLATEWAPHNIRVNSVAPGFIATDMVEKGSKTHK
uniref:Ketoreductase domain-containing protein n=1 Tax=Aegilops tauschii subsp. strangulata TaxID=200361 RepID=A0A453LD51_AEGTS